MERVTQRREEATCDSWGGLYARRLTTRTLAQMTKLVLNLILLTNEYLPSSNDQEVEMRTRARDRQVLYTTLND